MRYEWDDDEEARSANVWEQAQRHEAHGQLCRCDECRERDRVLFGHDPGPLLRNNPDDSWRIGEGEFEGHFTHVVRWERREHPDDRFL